MPASLCPAGCGRRQPAGKFLCSICWREVPKHLQNEVYRTWAAAKRDLAGFPAYRAAREAALAAIA
jgi:hypothetical protein